MPTALAGPSTIPRSILDIDLSAVRATVMKDTGWGPESADTAVLRYRRFLALILAGEGSVPAADIDEVWHAHILHTRQYAADCESIFGSFLHHRPVTVSGRDLSEEFESTRTAYKARFAEDYLASGPSNCDGHATCDSPTDGMSLGVAECDGHATCDSPTDGMSLGVAETDGHVT